MIFVTVGTHKSGFTRLVREIDRLAGELGEDVVAQIGYTQLKPKNITYFKFIRDEAQFMQFYKDASVVVTHGGASVLTSLVLGKPTVVVPRLRSEGEHCNDHQLHLAERLGEEGKVVLVTDVAELGDAIERAREKGASRVRINTKLSKRLREWILEAGK